MEMYVLPLGDCCCNYEVVAPGVSDGKRIHIPVAGYLLRLQDGGLALVDTGMNRVHVADPDRTWRGTELESIITPVMRPEDSLMFRLAELGAAPADIQYVVNTHLHFDHAGNNDLLSGAKFFVQKAHYEFAKENPMFPNQYWNLPNLSYELIDGQLELFPGVEVIPTPGHAPGHQSVVVRLRDSGTIVICGDAVNCQENFDYNAWSGQADPEAAQESALRLLDLARRENALMLYGHDRNQARTIRYSPASYA